MQYYTPWSAWIDETKKIITIKETPNTKRVKRDKDEAPVKNFAEVVSWLMRQAEKGLIRQRYKGLGEMTPEQLRDTTMDPKVRRMLRVRVEDAANADAIFSMLMGDIVEPRRAFIESNALFGNIDT